VQRNSSGQYLTIGLDRLIADRLVAGVNLTIAGVSTDAFQDTMKAESKGFTVGPYVAYRVSKSWTLFGSFSIGRNDNRELVGPLRADFGSLVYGTSVSATGQYELGRTILRPGLDVLYTHTHTGAQEMHGTIAGVPLALRADAFGAGYGTIEPSLEISRTFHLRERVVIPYVEPRAIYEYVRPGGGLMLTDELTKAAPKPWSGALRGGLRTTLTSSMFLDASVGYLSFGQPHLRIGGLRFFVSFGF